MTLKEAEKLVEDRIDKDPEKMFEFYGIDDDELFTISDEFATRAALKLIFGVTDPHHMLRALAGTTLSLGIAMGREIERAESKL